MFKILLFPFAILYNLVARVRNYLYDHGFKPSVKFDIPVICVGNLTAGGTGKTPMIEHLIRLLDPPYRLATLSRGYGRTTTGFRIAGPSDTASTIGDEPFQFFKKYKNKVTVAVGEERAFAIPNILQEQEDVQAILLDDAFQHRRVRPSFSILLSDYHRPFYRDLVLPAGRLRESRTGASRADVIIITKCPPEITEDQMMAIERSVRQYADKPVFFAKIHYGEPVSFGIHSGALSDQVVLVTGIANAKPMKEYATQNFKVIRHLDHTDHYTYRGSDLAELSALAKEHPQACFLTTEKDMVKLDAPEFKGSVGQLPFFYIPIETEFIKNGEDFDAMVLNAVRRAE
jgi:tetraacyldisaccharide 4'-kinase